jgi:glycosyltransferase involved in cell wall biosynthesis/pimeloyl-ACP methyl ester carboxylesterase
MRILIVTDSYHPHRSGLVRSITNLATGLRAAGHDVAILYPAAAPPTEAKETSEYRSLAVRQYKTIPVVGLRRALRDSKQAIDDFRPDIVHVHTPFSLGLTALWSAHTRRIQTVLTVHIKVDNGVGLTKKNGQGGRATRQAIFCVLRLLYGLAARMADLVSAPSAYGARWANSITGRRDSIVVSNGVFASQPNSPGPSLESRQVLYVGRLSSEKCVESLIRAASQATRRTPMTLKIVGDGPERSGIALLAARHPELKVSFEHDVSDERLLEIYRDSAIFCMPSECELECVAALEAMFVGLPLVVPRQGALDELANWSQAAVTYRDNTDPLELADCLARVMSDVELRRALSRRSIIAGKARSLDNVITQWSQAYRSVLKAAAEGYATDVTGSRTRAHTSTWERKNLHRPDGTVLTVWQTHSPEHGHARPTLLLLHGIAANSEVCWSRVVPVLTDLYDIVAIDCYGHGSHLGPRRSFSLEEFARDINNAILEMGISDCIVVGHSLGGAVAQLLLANEHATSYSGVVFYATAARFMASSRDRVYFAGFYVLREAAALLPSKVRIRFGRMYSALSGLDRDERFHADRFEWKVVLDAARAIARFDGRDLAPSLSCSSSVIVSQTDTVIDPQKQEELLALLPNAVGFHTELPHDASASNPEPFAALLLEAIDSVRKRTGSRPV